MRTAYLEVLRNLTFETIKLETRLSERQVAMLRWSQIDGDMIKTTRQRNVKVSREVMDALALLPRNNSETGLVFFGAASLSQPELEQIAGMEQRLNEPKRRFIIWKTKETHKRVDKSAMVC